jgi:hypothetical protein
LQEEDETFRMLDEVEASAVAAEAAAAGQSPVFSAAAKNSL